MTMTDGPWRGAREPLCRPFWSCSRREQCGMLSATVGKAIHWSRMTILPWNRWTNRRAKFGYPWPVWVECSWDSIRLRQVEV